MASVVHGNHAGASTHINEKFGPRNPPVFGTAQILTVYFSLNLVLIPLLYGSDFLMPLCLQMVVPTGDGSRGEHATHERNPAY
jgi:hypothetical protein